MLRLFVVGIISVVGDVIKIVGFVWSLWWNVYYVVIFSKYFVLKIFLRFSVSYFVLRFCVVIINVLISVVKSVLRSVLLLLRKNGCVDMEIVLSVMWIYGIVYVRYFVVWF